MSDQRDKASLLRHQALYDNLTGLPNRTLFHDRLTHALERAARGGESVAVMFMDIDHFKGINDTYGHDAGDGLLRQFSARISALIRQTDTFCRLGGDEFTLILEGNPSRAVIECIANIIAGSARQPFMIGGKSLPVSTSIGIATTDGKPIDAETLIKHADMALYETKRGGRDGFRFYTDGEAR